MIFLSEDDEEIAELPEDSLDMLFRAIEILRESIVPPERQKDADALIKAFNKYMTQEKNDG